jgi:hypothetical protein
MDSPLRHPDSSIPFGPPFHSGPPDPCLSDVSLDLYFPSNISSYPMTLTMALISVHPPSFGAKFRYPQHPPPLNRAMARIHSSIHHGIDLSLIRHVVFTRCLIADGCVIPTHRFPLAPFQSGPPDPCLSDVSLDHYSPTCIQISRH